MFLALKGLPLVLVSIVAFIIIIGLIICIHELGHFFFARKAGILCHEFSFGMGPALYKKKVGETTFCIRAIPIGGYVSMAGEEATDSYYKPGLIVGLNLDGEVVKEIILDENKEADIRGTIKTADLSGKDGGPLYITLDLGIQDHYFPVKNDAIYVFENNQTLQIEPYDRTFDSKTIWQRFITLFAGPMNNFILAIIIYLIASFATGVPNYKSNKVGSISGEAYPAYGVLQKGDILTKVNGNNVSSWSEFSKEADKAYETSTTIYITFTRAGIEKTESLEAISIIQSVGISNLGAAKLTPITSADGYKYKDSSNNMVDIESGLILGVTGYRNKNMDVPEKSIITKIKVDYDSKDEARGLVDGTFEVTDWYSLIQLFKDIKSQAKISFVDFYRINNNGTKNNADDDYYELIEESKTTTTYTDEVLVSQGIDKITNYIGVGPQMKFDFFRCIGNAFVSFGKDFTLIFRTLKVLLFPSGVRQIGVNDLSGFVGIFSIIEKYIGAGFIPLIAFAAMLSVNIGIMNLLPIPALDGGRIVFLLVEAITKKKPSKKVESIINTVFFVLLMILFVYITIHDIIRLF